MDSLFEVVNRKTAQRRRRAEKKQTMQNMAPVFIAVMIAMCFLLFALTDLVHPGLAMPIMWGSLMYCCFHLGRCARFRKRVH